MSIQTTGVCKAAVPIACYRGAEAERLVSSAEFQAQWNALLTECPWSTAAQGPAFIRTWYECYRQEYEPLVMARFGPQGALRGLLTLAVENAGGEPTYAGTYQAEYQAWLTAEGEETFLGDALSLLRGLGFRALTLQYLPPGAPAACARAPGVRTILEAVRRPLMDLDGEAAPAALARKKNRRRMQHLARQGPLEFVQLRTPEELEAHYDEITLFTDFRQAVRNGAYPFRSDPRRRAFLRELMRYPELAHVTVTKAGGALISAHLGIRDGDAVILGVLAHSPFAGGDSPGKLHILQLAILLREQGCSTLDLTPGGDPYKDLLASRHDEVHQLRIFFDWKSWLGYRAMSVVRVLAKRLGAALRIDPRALRAWAGLVRKRSVIAAVARAAASRLRAAWGYRVSRYRIAAERAVQGPGAEGGVRRNSLSDLLCYEPAAAWHPSKEAFLKTAMARMERGAAVYTLAEGGRLVSYAWLHEHRLWDFHVRASDYSGLFTPMLRDAAAAGTAGCIQVEVPARDPAARRAAAECGLSYFESARTPHT